MDVLDVAVIGCGSWGRNHARVYSDLPDINLAVIADINASRARGIGEKYKTSWTSEITDVFENPTVDAVSVCTPTVTHADIALKALDAGKHVLVEKPMTDTIDEAKELISRAKRKDLHIAVGFVERFNPGVRESMRLIESGEIGDVILAHSKRVSRRPKRIGDVGVIKDLGIHDVDIITHLFPDDPEMVFCTAGSIAHAFEDYANINLRFKENKNAFIETNWLTPRKIRDLTITGSEGIITVEYITQEVTVENNERLVKPFLPYNEPLYQELDSFTKAVINDRTPEVTGEDGLKALKICEAALESADTGEAIDFKSY